MNHPFLVHYSIYYLLLIFLLHTQPSHGQESSWSSCSSTVADILLLVDISQSVQKEIVEDRTFIKAIVNAFPIDGISLRMGLAVFSRVCKTILPVQEGISRGMVFDAIEKPWWPILDTNMHDCLDQIRTVDLHSRGNTSRTFIVLLITDEQPNDMKMALEAISRLQDEGAKFFLVLTKTPAHSGIAKTLGAENYVEAIRGKITDTRLADKIVYETCQKTCSIEEKPDVVGCGWDKQGNCVKNVDVKPSNPDHPACKNVKHHRKVLPCSSDICKELCDKYQWSQWDKACCGSNFGQKIEQVRTRPIPDHLFNEQVCPKKETFLCTINQECKEVIHRVKPIIQEKEAKSFFFIYMLLMGIVLILAVIAAACILSSRRRSADRFHRRLQAAGVSVPLAREIMTAPLDDKTREVLADLPLFTTYATTGYRTRGVGVSRHDATATDTLNLRKKTKTLGAGGKRTTTAAAASAPMRHVRTAPKSPVSKAKTGTAVKPSRLTKKKT